MELAPSNLLDAVPALLFRVQSRLCALPISYVIETMRPLPVKPFASTSRAVKGVSLIRGIPIPVVALAILLDDSDQEPTRFVTVKTGNHQIALTVDCVLGVHRITASSLQELPSLLKDADTSAVSAIGIADAELLLVLNTARLVPDGLWDALNTLRAA